MESEFDGCNAVLNTVPLEGAKLLHICSELAKYQGWQEWEPQLVAELVELMKGRTSVSGIGENRAGAAAYMAIAEDWDAYLQAHQAEVDPVFVEADPATGPGAPGALVAPKLPQGISANLVQPVPVGSSGCKWVLPGGMVGRSSADFFAGALLALNPGLVVRLHITNAAEVVYA
ncbi:hypothetical protein TSOC_001114 [Tetrabaena socialis]|uniref:Uncharacterized protein n=1 Tax=Tetrabaena socialis TaxID=47790 RepID=A0A2J8AHI9_9CHLO|nr:hypothetical protein TSOC_001114 [Tetrabaena socialis]|eukprot:PNH11988.1 hypothetical protein TSOC_001114 [Tetrabaena socialis]